MVSITPEVENHIINNFQWSRLPPSVKSVLGNAPGLYDKAVQEFSVRNQMRWRHNLVRYVIKDEKKYYEALIQYSREHLMLYPYHLQDMLVQGLRATPFVYYSNMLYDIMVSEKSYDSLPNFTAADCLRLMGIGRNEYIDLMNQYKSKKFFRRRGIRDLLPSHPVKVSRVEPWWVVHVGFVTEDDIRLCTPEEHKTIDVIIDSGIKEAGNVNRSTVLRLYNRGFIYFEIPIADADIIVVPPLQGFVMNRVQGDYFETLLYKIFVSIDEHTSISELASVLQVDIQLVKNAVSVFIRLGFAYKKSHEATQRYHASWTGVSSQTVTQPILSPLTLGDTPVVASREGSMSPTSPDVMDQTLVNHTGSTVFQKRLGFLFDSALTAFLMMGNLSPGLKNHAVTMFEVGKLTDESMDSFLVELGKVSEQAEGEARRYYEHAITLRNTLKFLRHNSALLGEEGGGSGIGVDLLRLESMASLDVATLKRVLQKNYSILVSMAPLSQEVQSVSSCIPPHLGPAVAEMNSIWFKLWLYVKLECGPTTLLLSKGSRMRKLPAFLKDYTRVLVTTWGHDPTSVFVSNLLLTVNDALTHSAVLIQVHGWRDDGVTNSVPFPFDRDIEVPIPEDDLLNHPCLSVLERELDLEHTCGYVTMLKTGAPPQLLGRQSKGKQQRAGLHQTPTKTGVAVNQEISAKEKAKQSAISEFLEDLKELGIGDLKSQLSALKPTEETKQNDTGTTKTDTQDTQPKAAPPTQVEPDNGASESLTDAQKKLQSEWVPLELSFGVPLFSEKANMQICEKILECGLLKSESLKKQTKANRLLALDLLTFISQYQDIPYFDGVDTSHFSDSNSAPPPVPMPTRNLLYMNGTLSNFDGR